MYTIVYRDQNGRWHRGARTDYYNEALLTKQQYELRGLKALIHRTDRLESIGMPDDDPPARNAATH